MLDQEIMSDKRPLMTVYAPGHEFIYKYFERAFGHRIVDTFEGADPQLPPVFILGFDDEPDAEMQRMLGVAHQQNLKPVVLRVPMIIGTGMNNAAMQLARNISRGTMYKLRDNNAVWAVVHASDIPEALKYIIKEGTRTESYGLPGTEITVNDIIDALAYRLNNKKIPYLSQRWLKILYSRNLYETMTTSRRVSANNELTMLNDFVFVNAADYMKTHVYDNESL